MTKTPARSGVYASKVNSRWIQAIGAVSLLLALMFAVAPGNKLAARPFEVLLAVGGGWAIVWVPRWGVYVEEDGVRVRNPFSTVRLQWSEIEEFVFRPYGWCRVKAVDGRSIALFGIQQRALALQRGMKGTRTALLINGACRR